MSLSRIGAVCALLILAGCGEKNNGQQTAPVPPASPSEAKSVQTNLEDVAFAVVNGRPVTAQFVKDTVCIMAKIQGLSTKMKMKPFGRWSNNRAMKITPGLVQATLFEQELDRRGVQATPDSDAKTLSRYNRILHKKAKNSDELAKLFGDLGPAFKRQFVRESRFAAFYATIPELQVNEADIASLYNSVSNQIERCRAINEKAHQKIDRAWEALNAGESWENVATNYTEDALLEPSYADNWTDWMSAAVEKLEPLELAQAVSAMKIGGYTKPIETDEGLIIAKVVEKEGDFVSLARILVRSAQDVKIPDREEAEQLILKGKTDNFHLEFQAELAKKAKIEYPLGRKFIYKIWEEEGSPKKKR